MRPRAEFFSRDIRDLAWENTAAYFEAEVDRLKKENSELREGADALREQRKHALNLLAEMTERSAAKTGTGSSGGILGEIQHVCALVQQAYGSNLKPLQIEAERNFDTKGIRLFFSRRRRAEVGSGWDGFAVELLDKEEIRSAESGTLAYDNLMSRVRWQVRNGAHNFSRLAKPWPEMEPAPIVAREQLI